MAKIADFGLSRGEEVYVKKTMVSAGRVEGVARAVLEGWAFFAENFLSISANRGRYLFRRQSILYFIDLHLDGWISIVDIIKCNQI